MPESTPRAMVGASLPFDTDKHGRIQRIALRAVASFAAAGRRFLHGDATSALHAGTFDARRTEGKPTR